MNEDVEITLLQDDVIVTEPLVADYILPTATASTLGGVKIGDNIQIDSGGHISVPMASANTLGLIKIGTGLNIDANGVVTATGEYTLPQATKTTLGGVYLDDELDSESVNPVQNSVITTQLGNVSSTVTSLSTTVGTLDDNLDTLQGVVSTLSGTVGDLSGDVSSNTSDIATNTSDITSLNTEVGNNTTAITNLGNAIDAISGLVNSLTTVISETYTYEDIDDQIWTAGEIDIRGKGFYAVMYINLEGSLTIPSGSSVNLFTLTQDYIPAYDAYGGADIVDGSISVKIDSATGNITLINNNTSSMNIGKLNASIPMIYGSI